MILDKFKEQWDQKVLTPLVNCKSACYQLESIAYGCKLIDYLMELVFEYPNQIIAERMATNAIMGLLAVLEYHEGIEILDLEREAIKTLLQAIVEFMDSINTSLQLEPPFDNT